VKGIKLASSGKISALLTFAVESVSVKACFAGAVEAAWRIDAMRVYTTSVVRLTFIEI